MELGAGGSCAVLGKTRPPREPPRPPLIALPRAPERPPRACLWS